MTTENLQPKQRFALPQVKECSHGRVGKADVEIFPIQNYPPGAAWPQQAFSGRYVSLFHIKYFLELNCPVSPIAADPKHTNEVEEVLQ